MKLLQAGVLDGTQVFAIFLTILLTIVSFFLSQFYFMVKDMVAEQKRILVADANHEQRINDLEDDMKEAKTDIKAIQNKR